MAQRKEKKKTKKKAVLAAVILVVIVAVIAVAAILWNSDTENYTEELTGYYGTDEELFAGNNSYSFPANIILLKPGDEWQVYYIEIEKMYETDGLSMEIEDLGDGNSTVDYTGNEVFTWDFDDYDSFAELYGG